MFPSLRWILPMQANVMRLQGKPQVELHVPKNSFHMLEYYYPTQSFAQAYRTYMKHALTRSGHPIANTNE